MEEVPLISESQLGPGRTVGSLEYTPEEEGWRAGTYLFRAELHAGGEYYIDVVEEETEVSTEAATVVVSWAILGAIIGLMFVSIGVILYLILRRRHRLLGV